MKKSIMSKSKRKWIVGGFAFFGGIALLTTGFAAWVFGVNQNTSGSGVSVGSDTAINDTVFLNIEVGEDKTLVLAEEVAHETKAQGEIAATQTNQGDGAITFNPSGMEIDLKYSVIWGKDQATPKAINLTLPTTSSLEGEDTPALPNGISLADYANNSIAAKDENVKYQKETRKGLNYFNAPEKINISAAAQNVVGQSPNADSFKLEATVKAKFTWGEFFNNVSPLNYYNSLSKALYSKIGTGDYSADKYLEEASVLSQQASEELNAMHKLFNGKQVYLLATLEQ